MMALAYTRRFFASAAAVAPRNKPRAAVNVAVGTKWKPVNPANARLARTGQKKVYSYTLYAKQLDGPKDTIKQVEFYPDIVDKTYLPESYLKNKGPNFQTQHDCWGTSAALVKVTMQDGSVKNLHKRIRFRKDNVNESRHRLVCKSFTRATNRAFGVELELACGPSFPPGKVRDVIKAATGEECVVPGYNTNTMKAWKVSTDNSITTKAGEHGVEIVSPILRGEAGLTKLCNMISAVAKNDAYTATSCGLHVHVDLSGVKFKDLKNLCKNWIKYEDAIDLFLPASRRASKNKYCLNVRDNMKFSKVTNAHALQMIDGQTTVQGLAKLMNAHPESRNRYHKLNMQNLSNKNNPRNTIEFRGYCATLDTVEIENWVRFLNLFVEASLAKGKPLPFADKRTPQEQRKRLLEKFVNDGVIRKYFNKISGQRN